MEVRAVTRVLVYCKLIPAMAFDCIVGDSRMPVRSRSLGNGTKHEKDASFPFSLFLFLAF